jgi:putative transposase
MARAYRHFIPGYVWHITHRCHRREFLLKFARDRSRWMELLFEAKRRYRLSILNFTVTSNHIHLVVASPKTPESIPKAIGRRIRKNIGDRYQLRETVEKYGDETS